MAGGEQALFVKRRQARGFNIEAQMDRGRRFVHVLAPGPLGANTFQRDLVISNGHTAADSNHAGACQAVS